MTLLNLVEQKAVSFDKNLQVLSFCQFLREKFEQVRENFHLEIESESEFKFDRPSKKKAVTIKPKRRNKIKSRKTVKRKLEKVRSVPKKATKTHQPKTAGLFKLKTLSGEWDPNQENRVNQNNSHNTNCVAGSRKEEPHPNPNPPQYMSVFEGKETSQNFNKSQTTRLLRKDVQDCREELRDIKGQLEERLSHLHRTQEIKFSENQTGREYVAELEERLRVSEQEKDFFKSKLQECERQLLGNRGGELPERLHSKLHAQQDLIEKLKTDLCNANIHWNEKLRDAQSALNFEKGNRRALEAELETSRKEARDSQSQAENVQKKLEGFENENAVLLMRLASRDKEVGMLNRTIDQMQEEIRRALKGGGPISTGDWEMDTLRKMAQRLSKESANLYQYENDSYGY